MKKLGKSREERYQDLCLEYEVKRKRVIRVLMELGVTKLTLSQAAILLPPNPEWENFK